MFKLLVNCAIVTNNSAPTVCVGGHPFISNCAVTSYVCGTYRLIQTHFKYKNTQSVNDDL